MINKQKVKYEGIFNIYGQRIREYTWAVSPDQAMHHFINKISKKYNISVHLVRSIFSGNRDNFQILEVN